MEAKRKGCMAVEKHKYVVVSLHTIYIPGKAYTNFVSRKKWSGRGLGTDRIKGTSSH